MRKFIAVMSVMMLLPILAACSSKGSDGEQVPVTMNTR